MGSSRLLLGAIVVAVLVSSGIAAALVTFEARTLPAQAQHEFERSGSTSIGVSAQITQAEATTDGRIIAASIRSALGAVLVRLDSALWSDPFRLPGQHEGARPARGIQVLAQAAALDGVTANAALAAGTWPSQPRAGQPIPAALPLQTARVLRVRPGDLLTVHDSYTGAPVRFRITGTFRPRNPTSPYWALSLLGTSGSYLANGYLTYGPLIIGRAAFGPGRLAVIQASWAAIPDVSRIPVANYAGLASKIRAAQASLAQPGAHGLIGGLTVTTGMPQFLDASASNLVVARSLVLIGALELLLIAVATIALSAQRLTTQREEESALLSARGMARRQLALRAGGEAVALAALPAAAGAVAGSRLATSGLHSASSTTTVSGIVWLTAGAIIAGCAAVMLWPVLSPGGPGAASVRRGRQASLASTVIAGADVALVALGALALWQLRLFSAAPRGASGRLGVYPVLAVAPALALAGAAMILLRALPALARAMDKLAARARRLTASLASWQISRRPVRQIGPALLVVVAVAAGTLALAEHQSWLQSAGDRADFTAGADVRVDLPTPLPLGESAAVTHAEGVTAAMSVARFGYNRGGEVLAVNSRQAGATVLLRPDLATQNAAALWRDIAPAGPEPGLELPGTPTRLRITARLGPAGALARAVGEMSVSVSVQDADGIVYSVPAGRLGAGQHQLVARLSATHQGSYPLRLLAVTLTYTLPPDRVSGHMNLTVGGLADSAAPAGKFPAPFASGGVLHRWQAGLSAPVLLDNAAGLRKGSARLPSLTRVRASPRSTTDLAFAPGYGTIPAPAQLGPTPVTAVLTLTTPIGAGSISAIATDAFLSANRLHVRDFVSVMVGSNEVTARIVAAVREFPTVSDGTGGGLIMDQAALQDQLVSESAQPIPVTEWWLRTATGGIPSHLPAYAVTTDRARVAAALLKDPLNQAQQLALLASAVAAGILAALGFSVSVVGSIRERRAQSALLAALGVDRGAQARQLCIEQLVLSVPAACVGLLLGAGLAWLVVPVVTLTGSGQAPIPAVLVRIPLALAVGLALCVTVIPVLAAAATVAHRPDPAAQLRAAGAT